VIKLQKPNTKTLIQTFRKKFYLPGGPVGPVGPNPPTPPTPPEGPVGL